MSPLQPLLKERIARHGPISFHDFMAAALYDPAHGYYAANRATIGRKGDFFTNVSVGPLFGRLLARQFAEMWTRLGEPKRFTIVEQGAHGGEFAHDVLTGLRDFAPACLDATRYVVVEPFDRLRRRQMKELGLAGTGVVEWRASLSDLEPFEGVHFSNELGDAFPVHRVRWSGVEWFERYVDWHDERFVFLDGPLSSPTLRKRLAVLPTNLPAGYETEISLAAPEWIAELASKIRRGWALLVDYGYPRDEYYRPERAAGTLSGYSSHRRAPDLLATPGEIDLTAHLDFTSLTERAETAGFLLRGFSDQHHFVVGLSRLHFTDSDSPSPETERELRAFKTLMHPNLMGASFKALCLEKTDDALRRASASPLSGFVFARDPRAMLGLKVPG